MLSKSNAITISLKSVWQSILFRPEFHYTKLFEQQACSVELRKKNEVIDIFIKMLPSIMNSTCILNVET